MSAHKGQRAQKEQRAHEEQRAQKEKRALKEQRAQQDIGRILESLGYAYFEVDLSGTFTRANQSFCRGIGYTEGELKGSHYRRILDQDEIRPIYQLFNQVYRTRQAQKRVQFKFRKRDGSLSNAEGSMTLITGDQGEPLGFRGIVHDITERKHQEESLKNAFESVERDLEIGRRIQKSFLPKTLPQPKGWEISGVLQPAREVSGDFYDAFSLSGGKRTGLVIADVCDKGVGSALFMALFRSLIRAFADQHFSLGWMDILNSGSEGASGLSGLSRRRALLSTGATPLKKAIDLTNKYILENHGDTNMFATIFFAILDPAVGSLMYINAGHPSPLVIDSSGVKSHLQPTGPAVGLLPGLEFNIEQIDLAPGEMLLAFTDGVTDVLDPAGHEYSESRLERLAAQTVGSAGERIERIMGDLMHHMDKTDQYDDITLLALRRKYEKE
ncbi:MAG: SpoIIE family protein phosphatase [Anaerolineales bacterium]